MIDQSTNAIKQKITKLLAMAATGSGATEDEAATAMKMAMALMARHGIEQSELGGVQIQAKFSSRVRTREQKKGSRDTAAMLPHQVSLASAAGCLYGCKALFYDRGKQGFVFVGRNDNMDAAEITLFWLIRQVDELYKTATAQKFAGLDTAHEYRSQHAEFRATFKQACSDRVWSRALALMQNPTLLAQATGRTELVVKDYFEKLAAEAEQAIVQQQGVVKAMHTKRRWGNGTSAGYAAGDKVQLRKEVAN